MNEERMAIDIFAVLAKHTLGTPVPVAKRDASAWVAGVRDHRISDFCCVNMPRCRRFAEDWKRDCGL
jgi:hypothetical protein